MKKIKLTFFALSALSFSSCSLVNSVPFVNDLASPVTRPAGRIAFKRHYPNWDKVQEGMSKAQVQGLMGRPYVATEKSYIYKHSGAIVSYRFDEDTKKLVSWSSVR